MKTLFFLHYRSKSLDKEKGLRLVCNSLCKISSYFLIRTKILKKIGMFLIKLRATFSRPKSNDKWAKIARSLLGSNVPHQRLSVVSNEQMWRGLMRSHNLSLRLTSWNIRYLTGKYVKLAEIIIRRNIKILCL